MNGFAKAVVWINCGVPAALLAYDASQGHLGVNPVAFALRTTGLCALIFLMLTLAVTPLSQYVSGIVPHRRTLGLSAFFYAVIHVMIFIFGDRAGDLESAFWEIYYRNYLMVGALAVLLMVPLALTSTRAMMKRLGGRRWKQLHRLTYFAAIAGVTHFTMQVKADLFVPYVFIAILSTLLLYRLVMRRYRN